MLISGTSIFGKSSAIVVAAGEDVLLFSPSSIPPVCVVVVVVVVALSMFIVSIPLALPKFMVVSLPIAYAAAPEEAASALKSASTEERGSETKEYDIYRDSPLRYMGYANECGEAFAAWLPPFGVPATYGVAAVYVLADTFDKAIKANKEKGIKEGVIVGLDTVTWQMLASVFWPGSFIRVMVNATNLLVSKLPADLSLDIGGLDAATIEKALPTAIGLMTIPFIVKPIDKTIDWAMEESVTKVLRGKCESPADYAKAAGIVGACLAVPPALFTFAGVIGDLAA